MNAPAKVPTPTGRQQRSLDRVADELRDRWALHAHFDLTFEDEVRPGRGHDLRWTVCDGEKLAQGSLDVYGNGEYGVGEVDWVHYPEDCEGECCVGPSIVDVIDQQGRL